MGNPDLRVIDDLLIVAVQETVIALDPPAEDAAMVTLAFQLAKAIDGMAPAVRDAMIAQVSGQLMRVLKELDDRARRRRGPQRQGRANKVTSLRAAHAKTMAKRTAG